MMAEELENDSSVGLRSLKGASVFLGVSQSQIYRLGQSGELELVKVGRLTRVTQVSLDRYVANAKRMVPHRRRTPE